MSAFHPFPRLPYEIRSHIWALTVEPRIVEVRGLPENSLRPSRFVSPTPVPAILQACREARHMGLYEQSFSDILTNPCPGAESESRYVWLNLSIDMVSIGKTPFKVFAPVAASIKRLRFERENTDDSFYHFEAKELPDWVNAEEVHVVCGDGIEAWHGASYDHSWPCALEHLWFLDPHDGRMMRSMEMEQMLDDRLEERYRQEDETVRGEWADSGYDYPSGTRLG